MQAGESVEVCTEGCGRTLRPGAGAKPRAPVFHQCRPITALAAAPHLCSVLSQTWLGRPVSALSNHKKDWPWLPSELRSPQNDRSPFHNAHVQTWQACVIRGDLRSPARGKIIRRSFIFFTTEKALNVRRTHERNHTVDRGEEVTAEAAAREPPMPFSFGSEGRGRVARVSVGPTPALATKRALSLIAQDPAITKACIKGARARTLESPWAERREAMNRREPSRDGER
ncbi:hypothetical protein AAFF_G00166770 [Aldrovandia affinis]|uniref:Uncharacterized protein n=1 Tax=Aldrovandia affinis TaxID=143900 RepID=A0AAD7W7Z1_9TELE|nr:hypothetical protein AAFF_G00166770 [Aldrovandia affinis]